MKAMRHQELSGLLCGLCVFLSFFPTAPIKAGGVTLIAHGFNSGVTDWVIPMAGEMAEYPGFPGTESTCYILEVTSTSQPATAVWRSGVRPNLSDSGEIFIKLDWSAVDGLFQASTETIAGIAVNALLDPGLISEDTGGRPLAELPLHLVGHSRGASVVTEMARILGENGIWVDQVTTLDRYPLGLNGDAPVLNWENVLFADNYWQEFESIRGDYLNGCFNRELTNLSGGNSSAHSDVHLWYHGTADLETPSTSAEADITQAMRDVWWTTVENEGAEAGFRFSRLGGGDRLSDFQPAGVGTDRVLDGYNGVWDLGGGLVSNRTPLEENSGAWPNVITCQRSESSEVTAGDTFDLNVHYQGGADALGQLSLTVLLDPDHNPWNGNEFVIDAGMWPTTGTAAVSLITISVPTTGLPSGSYAVAAELSDGSHTRSLYVRGSVEIVAPPLPPEIDGATVRIEGGAMTFTVLGTIGQVVEVRASQDLVNWTTIATQELTTESWDFSDDESLTSRYYRVREEP